MKEYEIKFKNDQIGDIEFKTVKWAHDEKSAVRLLLQKNPDADGRCVFKRGGTGKIISVKDITGGEGLSNLVKDCEELLSPDDGGSTPPTSTIPVVLITNNTNTITNK